MRRTHVSCIVFKFGIDAPVALRVEWAFNCVPAPPLQLHTELSGRARSQFTVEIAPGGRGEGLVPGCLGRTQWSCRTKCTDIRAEQSMRPESGNNRQETDDHPKTTLPCRSSLVTEVIRLEIPNANPKKILLKCRSEYCSFWSIRRFSWNWQF